MTESRTIRLGAAPRHRMLGAQWADVSDLADSVEAALEDLSPGQEATIRAGATGFPAPFDTVDKFLKAYAANEAAPQYEAQDVTFLNKLLVTIGTLAPQTSAGFITAQPPPTNQYGQPVYNANAISNPTFGSPAPNLPGQNYSPTTPTYATNYQSGTSAPALGASPATTPTSTAAGFVNLPLLGQVSYPEAGLLAAALAYAASKLL